MLLFLDTETTSPNPLEARVIELATGTSDSDIQTMLIDPGEKLSAAVQATTTISNRMLEGKPSFMDLLPEITERLKIEDDVYYVAHNAKYDRTVLLREFQELGLQESDLPFLNQDRWICTMRLAKQFLKVDPEEQVKPGYGLQYLRYFLELDIPDDIGSHRADVDVLVLAKLVEKLIESGLEQSLIEPDAIEESLVFWTQQPIKFEVFPFGKHKGVPLEDIPRDYWNWAMKNIDSFKEDHPNYNQDLVLSVLEVLENS